MKTDVENNEWKAEAPYLAGLQKENPFIVPNQYFDTLSESIANSVYLSELKDEIPMPGFSVPEQYFTTLQDSIIAVTSGSILNDIPSSTGYTTPDLYFQKLQSSILAKTTEVKPGKVVRLWRSGLLKYASAACFILISTFGIYLNQHNFTNEATAVDIANEQMLYDISEQDVIDHVEANTTQVQNNSVPDTDMENYILNNYSQNDLSSAL